MAKKLAIPFIAWALLIAYLTFVENQEGVAIWIIPPILAVMAIYVLSPQIDWWWYNRYPPKPDVPLIQFLESTQPFYRQLDLPLKKEFVRRLQLYMLGNDFSGMAIETISEDMKAGIASFPVTMTLWQKDFMLAPFERIVIYPHPFPSPAHPFLHACEFNEEDGVIVFSLEQLLQSQLRPDSFASIGFYLYSQIYRRVHPERIPPQLKDSLWKDIDQLGGFDQDHFAQITGFEEPDLWGSVSSLFFTKPETFLKKWPELYQQLEQYYHWPGSGTSSG